MYKAWILEQTGFVRHAFTTRIGGVSGSPYDTLNMGLHVEDDRRHVLDNRARAAHAAGMELRHLTTAEQIHGDKVAVVRSEQAGRGGISFEDSLPGVDALITKAVGPVLTLFYADCVPVYIVDPVNRAIGLVHAGWKGTALSIAAKTIEAMRANFGTDPGQCVAAIGPSIGRCCYDVSMEVALKIRDAVGDDRAVARANQDQWRIDLKLANWITLRASGVPEDNIALARHCTSCNHDDFFSYRREGRTGRMAAMMGIDNGAR